MESNWRFNCWASGWCGTISPPVLDRQWFKKVARLNPPVPTVYGDMTALGQLHTGSGDVPILGTDLGLGYVFWIFQPFVPVGTPFPYGYSVVPDHPAVPWV